MVLLPCPRWALLPELYTPDGLNVFLAIGFFLCHTLSRYWRFLLSLGDPVYGSGHQCSFLLYRFSLRMFSCSYFILLCYRIFSSGFWSSVSSDDCQVNQLKQKLKLTLFASRASGKSENYLTTSTDGQSSPRACWAFPFFLSVLWIVPSTCSLVYSLQSRRLPLTAHFSF